MLKFSAGLRIGQPIENWFGEVHTFAYRYRTAVAAEQGTLPRFQFQQTPHREGDPFRLVAAGETVGRCFDQSDHVWAVDGDNGGHREFQPL
jgi:hypothetical protein